jgi:hypothetical protein
MKACAMSPPLSKSRFMAGRQCRKRLYFEVHNPELARTREEFDNATLNTGVDPVSWTVAEWEK